MHPRSCLYGTLCALLAAPWTSPKPIGGDSHGGARARSRQGSFAAYFLGSALGSCSERAPPIEIRRLGTRCIRRSAPWACLIPPKLETKRFARRAAWAGPRPVLGWGEHGPPDLPRRALRCALAAAVVKPWAQLVSRGESKRGGLLCSLLRGRPRHSWT